MRIKKSKLKALILILVMISTVSAYSQTDIILTDGATMTFAEKQQESLQKIKTCSGMKDMRIITTKSFEIMQKWVNAESHDKKRSTTQSHDRTTMNQVRQKDGVFWAISLPNSKESKKKTPEAQRTEANMLKKIETCLASENIRAVETKDKTMLENWVNGEDEGREITTHFDTETGIYSAISTPKTSGHGKVMFRKID